MFRRFNRLVSLLTSYKILTTDTGLLNGNGEKQDWASANFQPTGPVLFAENFDKGPYAQTDYIVELWLVEDYMGNPGGLLQTVNHGGYGEGETLQQDGVPFFDDAGLYEVVVYAFDGGGCESNYNLEISFTN